MVKNFKQKLKKNVEKIELGKYFQGVFEDKFLDFECFKLFNQKLKKISEFQRQILRDFNPPGFLNNLNKTHSNSQISMTFVSKFSFPPLSFFSLFLANPKHFNVPKKHTNTKTTSRIYFTLLLKSHSESRRCKKNLYFLLNFNS